MSGTGKTTKSIAITGDQTINGVLSGIAWGGNSITYSLPTSKSEYTYSGEPNTFGKIASSQFAAIYFALDKDKAPAASAGFTVEGFTNLDISLTTSAGANIRFANTDSTLATTAWAYYPSTGSKGGDVWFAHNTNYLNPAAGNYAWHTHLHEIGHALGLKHGNETDGFGALPSAEDSMEYSVMTYRSYSGSNLGYYTNETWGYAQTYMMADIAALQHMYGADFTTNSGDTVYKWDPNSGDTLVNGEVGIDAGGNRIFATIWDGGGIDTYDLSAYTTNLVIDLQAGGHSVFSSVQLANLGSSKYASGNIYNALQYNGDARSLIENAIGGSGNDNITGNQAANTLWGGGGHDKLYGLDGKDTLYGGSGNDTLYGDAGNDSLYGGVGFDKIAGGAGDDRIWGELGVDVLSGGVDNDTIFGGEHNDSLYGNDGDDWLYGDSGFDRIAGGAGSDHLYGGLGVDLLFADGGDDFLYGEGQNDQLNGGAGEDWLDGGAGNDTLTGGTGADTFAFVDMFGIDTIKDFDVASQWEKINLECVATISDWTDLVTNHMSQVGGNIEIVDGLGNKIIIEGCDVNLLSQDDFVFMTA